MKKLLTLIAITLFIGANAQRGIATSETGPKTLDPSAIIDAEATTKGMLIPRIILSATNVAAPVVTPANSLLVYNTATAGTGATAVSPGYYYWDTPSTQWVRLMAASDSLLPKDSVEWVDAGAYIYARRAKNAGRDVVVTDAGSLGINTVSPVGDFQINDTTGRSLVMKNTGGSSQPFGFYQALNASFPVDNTPQTFVKHAGSGTSGTSIILQSNDGAIYISNVDGTNNTTQEYQWDTTVSMTITPQRKVGIGTRNPTELLELRGGGIQLNDSIGIGFNGELPYNDTVAADGLKMYVDNDFFGTFKDGFIIEKTDNQNLNPDGGIAFTNKGGDNIRETSMVITGDGNVGIGTITPSSKLHIDYQSKGDTNEKAALIDLRATAATLTTANASHSGLNVNFIAEDIVGTATNGQRHTGTAIGGQITTTGTTRGYTYYSLFGRSTHNSSGDVTDIFGTYSVAQTANAATSSGNIDNLRGTFTSAQVNANSTGLINNATALYAYSLNDNNANTVPILRGNYNQARNNSGTVTNAYGDYNLIFNDGVGTINNAYGDFTWLIQDDAGGTTTNSYAYYGLIDQDGGTSTNGYLFRGDYDGVHGTKWGLYLTNETKSYLSGQHGIGTTNPSDVLHVSRNQDANTYIKVSNNNNSANAYPAFYVEGQAPGDYGYLALFPASTSFTALADQLVLSTGSTVTNGLKLVTQAQHLYFSTGGGGGASDRMFIHGTTGNVGIANVAPTQKLDVTGNIRASGSFISGATTLTVPDYVFEKYYTGESMLKADYTFKSLEEIENFTKANGHLPGITSAKEIKEEGSYNLTQSTLNNLEKIEELYLHLIEVNKEKEALKAQAKKQEVILELYEKRFEQQDATIKKLQEQMEVLIKK